MRAASLLLALACTRANPAYFPTDGTSPPIDRPPPDAAAAAIAPLDAAPPPPDAAPLDADAAADAASGVTFTDPGFSMEVMPANPGGEGFDDPCGPGEVLVGLVGTVGTNLFGANSDLLGVNSVQARCAAAVTAGKPGGFGTGASRALAAHGTEGPDRQNATCPADQVIVGFEGTTGQWIDRLYVHCASVEVQKGTGFPLVIIGEGTRLPVGLGKDTPETLQLVRCDTGKIAVGIRGASGLAVDSFGLRCARPQLR
jgi:hypothetical protein